MDGEEIRRIASFLKISPSAFRSQYCAEINGRLSIISAPDGFCVFFDRERMCLIHTVKPDICALWPFYTALLRDPGNWRMAQDACPGINPNCSHEDFVKQSKTRGL